MFRSETDITFDLSIKTKTCNMEKQLTYDVQFDNNDNSNSNGFSYSLQECKDYISRNNGTNKSYFADYKGGIVSIICNQTGETVHAEEVK